VQVQIPQFCKYCKFYAGKQFIVQGLGDWGEFKECCLVGEKTKVFAGYNELGEKEFKYPIFKNGFKESGIAGIWDYTFINGKLYIAIERLRDEKGCKFFEPKWYIKLIYKIKDLFNLFKKEGLRWLYLKKA